MRACFFLGTFLALVLGVSVVLEHLVVSVGIYRVCVCVCVCVSVCLCVSVCVCVSCE